MRLIQVFVPSDAHDAVRETLAEMEIEVVFTDADGDGHDEPAPPAFGVHRPSVGARDAKCPVRAVVCRPDAVNFYIPPAERVIVKFTHGTF